MKEASDNQDKPYKVEYADPKTVGESTREMLEKYAQSRQQASDYLNGLSHNKLVALNTALVQIDPSAEAIDKYNLQNVLNKYPQWFGDKADAEKMMKSVDVSLVVANLTKNTPVISKDSNIQSLLEMLPYGTGEHNLEDPTLKAMVTIKTEALMNYSLTQAAEENYGVESAQYGRMNLRLKTSVASLTETARLYLNQDDRGNHVESPIYAQRRLAGVREKVIDNLLFNTEELAMDVSLDLAEPLSGFELVEFGEPLYNDVKDSLANYNAAHPDAQLDMPKIVLLSRSEIVGTAYMPNLDAVIVHEKEVQLPKEERQAIIAHELGHKGQFESGEIAKFTYDIDKHMASISPEVAKECAAAGVLPEQLKAMLPSGRYFDNGDVTGGDVAVVSGTAELSVVKNIINNPDDMLDSLVKASGNPECLTGILKTHTSLPSVVAEIQRDYLADSRATELDADIRGAKASGPEVMADALSEIHFHHNISYSAKEEGELTHPAEETRFANIEQHFGANTNDKSGAASAVPNLKPSTHSHQKH